MGIEIPCQVSWKSIDCIMNLFLFYYLYVYSFISHYTVLILNSTLFNTNFVLTFLKCLAIWDPILPMNFRINGYFIQKACLGSETTWTLAEIPDILILNYLIHQHWVSFLRSSFICLSIWNHFQYTESYTHLSNLSLNFLCFCFYCKWCYIC